MPTPHQLIAQMVRSLRQLDSWMGKAAEYAKSRSFDPNLFLGLRMAPDQFPFERQVQIACDTIRLGVARITGIDPQPVQDTEKSLAELRERVNSTVEMVTKVQPGQYEGSATRTFTTPRWQGKQMNGHDYLLEHLMPNFHFHLVHCYAILRQAGVPLGKSDYLGTLTMK